MKKSISYKNERYESKRTISTNIFLQYISLGKDYVWDIKEHFSELEFLQAIIFVEHHLCEEKSKQLSQKYNEKM